MSKQWKRLVYKTFLNAACKANILGKWCLEAVLKIMSPCPRYLLQSKDIRAHLSSSPLKLLHPGEVCGTLVKTGVGHDSRIEVHPELLTVDKKHFVGGHLKLWVFLLNELLMLTSKYSSFKGKSQESKPTPSLNLKTPNISSVHYLESKLKKPYDTCYQSP